MKGFFSFKKNKGFTMLEMIIATFILVVGIISVYSSFARITIATSIVSSKLTAAYLAQEGIEIIRNIRDTNWLKGFNQDNGLSTTCSLGCEADYTTKTVEQIAAYAGMPLCINTEGFYNHFSGSQTIFKRKITITSPVADVLLVSVLIEWEDRGTPYNFTAEESLYDWY
ncbi:prepilin-type N-terminal cleavage/methylation domain-containing protein [Patescibacteria group bacterium]|nr:prepilin-type N-terminal cleavage/methylation domain-containing protein [Patescibacteria group bacterium]MBU4367328.1 prepilin-type N-terminal cleavage/methylation domain-containing protein [Patescibacteria group bacterium]MBU4461665.1 prepilin-type N-terminal cleavage/methylation domain-containing protein [Patescibacteria group bacterium]MCG2699716.1 prepilin-type N-terminal cleavage/methylation domain-containing protein [Candidatus Parcubacteria bacterium]